MVTYGNRAPLGGRPFGQPQKRKPLPRYRGSGRDPGAYGPLNQGVGGSDPTLANAICCPTIGVHRRECLSIIRRVTSNSGSGLAANDDRCDKAHYQQSTPIDLKLFQGGSGTVTRMLAGRPLLRGYASMQGGKDMHGSLKATAYQDSISVHGSTTRE